MGFKKGELTQESLDVILQDLSMIIPHDKDGVYYANLIIDNLRDVWGLQTKNETLKNRFINYFHTLTSDEQNRILNDMGQ